MFAQLNANDVIQSKSDNNNSPMIRFEKQQSFVQKYQINNLTHHHNNNNNNNGNNNRKKFQKMPTVNNNNNNSSNNKNHHNNNNNNQSYSTSNNRKKSNHQFNSTTKPSNIINNNNNNNNHNNNNTNGIKNQNISYTPTKGTARITTNMAVKNNTNNNNNNNIICSDQILVPKNTRCDNLVSKNIASDIISTSSKSTSTFQKPATSSNLLVSSSSSLSSSSSSSTTTISSTNSTSSTNNRNRIATNQRFGSASNHHHRKKLQVSELDLSNQKSPIPIMVVNGNGGGGGNQQQQQQKQQHQQQHPHQQHLPAVFTTPICTTSSASSSAPVSPCSYSLNFLHSVGVQMTGGADTRHHLGHNHHHPHHHHVYSSSATVSPAGSTQNMLIQGQRIIYQDIPPAAPAPDKRNINNNNNNNNTNGQRKFSPKVQSPSYTHRSYDIPILINNNITHSVGDHFSPYNYPPLNSNNNYKRNSYIPLSFPYQKSQNDNNNYPAGSVIHTPTFNRNRNQSKAWNNNGGNVNAHSSTSNGMSKHNSDFGSSQNNSRVSKNHQNISNLTYVTTATEPNDGNMNLHLNGNISRSQSSSPKMDFPPPPLLSMSNRASTTNKSDLRLLTQAPSSMAKGDSFSPGHGDDNNTQLHQRVASEGYESDSSNSSTSCDKRASTGHSNFLSSSSSSLSSTEISYHPPPLSSLGHNINNFPSSFAEDDPPMQHFYGSEQNLSQWIPALHAQFMYSAHGIYPPTGSLTDFQQQQIKKSQTNRSSYRGGRDRFLGRSHVAEVKEAPRSLLTCSKWDNLSQGIWNKFVSAQQTEDTFKRKMRLWRYLYIIVKNSYPRLGLYLVGSTMSGFGADSSDIDMCLVSKAFSTIDSRMEALFNLTLLRDCLIKTGEFEKFNLIEAKVPILRFKDRVHNLEVDLNFNNCVGIKNTHLLFCYSQLDWRLRPLVLVTKLWAQYHNINNAKNMTISSYSLVLMVIHFLQCAVSPPVLPCLHELYPDKFHFLHRTNDFGCVDMNETIGPYDSQNNQPIGQLFLEFLQYYSNFNYSQFAISIRTGALIPIEYCRQAKSIKNDIHQWKELCIEEPFDLTNTARSVYDSETFERVKLVFITSYRVLQETLDINSIFTQLVPAGPVQENK